jgi:hypothetical protein
MLKEKIPAILRESREKELTLEEAGARVRRLILGGEFSQKISCEMRQA